MSTLADDGLTPVAQPDSQAQTLPNVGQNIQQAPYPRATSVAGPIPDPPSAALAADGLTPVPPDDQPVFVPPIVAHSLFKDQVTSALQGMPSDQAFDQSVRMNLGNLKYPLMAMKGISPDVAAQVDQMARNYGLPFSTALSGKEDLGSLDQAKQIYPSLYATDDKGQFIYPNTVKWMNEWSNLAKAHDDIDALTGIENAVRAQNQAGESSWFQTARGAASGTERSLAPLLKAPAILRTSAVSEIDQIANDAGPIGSTFNGLTGGYFHYHEAPDNPDWLETFFGLTRAINQHADANDAATLQGRSIAGDFAKGDYTGAAQSTAVALASFVPTIAAAAADPAFGLAVGGGGSAASQYQNDLENDKSPMRAGQDAVLNLGVNVAGMGTLGTVGQMQRMKTLFSKPIDRETATALWGRIARQSAASAVQGAVAQAGIQAGTDAADYATGNAAAFDHETQKLVTSALLGFIADGALSAPIGALDGIRQLAEQENGASAWQRLTDSTQQSKLLKRDPNALAQVITQNLTTAGKPTTVGIDAEKLVTFFQNRTPEDLKKFSADMGITPADITNAAATGGSVDLPIGPYQAKYVGTDLDKAISKDLRFTPGGLSENELADQIAHVKTLGESIKAELAKNAPEDVKLPDQIKAIRDSLMLGKDEGGMGYTADQADAQIAVLMAGIKHAVAQPGESVSQAVGRLGLGVKIGGEVPEGALNQGENTDAFKKWSAGSKVVDETGAMKVMYHGTPKADFETFDTYGSNHGLFGQGSYFTDNQKVAEGYAYKGRPKPTDKPAIYPVYLSIKHPMDMDAKADVPAWSKTGAAKRYEPDFKEGMTNGDAYKALERAISDTGEVPHGEATEELQSVITGMGHDGLTHEGGGKHGKSDGTKHSVYVAFDPEQIKSSTANHGTFDPSNPNIRHQGERGAITFGDGQTTIHLFKSADMSTFAHEAAHLFLKGRQDLIDKGLASSTAVADHQALLDFAGVKPGEKLDRASEEKIVTAFESYLRDGKAPSVELAAPFARFRTWLTNIYRSLTSLGVKPTDEVKQVFDRMLASEDDISHAQEYYSRKSDVLDLIKADEAEKQEVRAKLNKVKLSETDKTVRAYLKSYLQAIGGAAEIRAAAKKVVEAQPIYQALETAKAGRIDEDSLLNAIGTKGVKEFNDKFPNLVKKNGEHTLQDLALKHNFESPETLADNLLAAVPKSEAIKNYTSRLVAEKEQQLREEIMKNGATPADGVMHTEGSLAYLIAETNLMAKQLSKGKPIRVDAQAYRDAARQALSDMPVRKAVRYSDFAKTEARLAKRVFDLAKRGQWEDSAPDKDGNVVDGAITTRRKQIAQHAMVQESIKARDERDAIVKRYAPSSLESKLKNVDNEYVDPARQILSTYGLSDIKPSKPYNLDDLSAVDTVLYSQIPTWILSGENAGDYRNLAWGQLQDVDATARGIIGFGNDLMKSGLALKEKTIGEVVEKSVENIAKLPANNPRQFGKNAAVNAFIKLGQTWDWTKSMVIKAQFAFDILDNFSTERTGSAGVMRQMFDGMRIAEHNQSEAQREVYMEAQPHLKVLEQATKRLRKENGAAFSIPGVEKPAAYDQRGQRNWTPDQLIAYMLNTGAEGNLASLKNAFGHGTAEIDRVAQHFSAKELAAIEGLRNSIGKLFDGLNDTNFKLYNRNVENVEPVAQDLTDNTGAPVRMKGGYWPLVFDYGINRMQGKLSEQDILQNSIKGFMRSSKPEDGMTKSRVIGHSLAPRLDMGVFADHIDDTTRFIHMAPLLRDINRVMQNPKWRDAAISKMGATQYDQLSEWLKYQSNPGRKQTTELMRGLDQVADYARSLSTESALGLNFVAGLKWRTSMINSAVALGGWRHIAEGYKALGTKGLGTAALGLSNSKTWKMIESKSTLLATREAKGVRDLQQDVEKLKWNRASFKIPGTDKTVDVNTFKHFTYEWAKMNDRAVIAPVWMGAYTKYVNEMGEARMTPEQRDAAAVSYADGIIQSSQPSSLNVDMNSMQRNQAAYMKLFTMFMSYPYTIGNRFMYMAKALQSGAITKTQYISHVVQEGFLEPYARLAITNLALHTLPAPIAFAVAPITNLLGTVPGLSNISNEVQSLFDPAELSPVFDGLKKAARVTQDVIKQKDIELLAWDVARLTTYLTGTPILNVIKTILDFEAESKGEKNPYK